MEERTDFTKGELQENNIPTQPMDLIRNWLDDAKNANVSEYQAMVVSTLGMRERISSRVVYARAIVDEGLVFYTNYFSRKGREALENNLVSVNFFWKELERQIRIEGRIDKIGANQSDVYFMNRPRGSQIGAWASEQSQIIPDRAYLESRVERFESQYEGKEVPRPAHWGGYLIVPDYVEFWQGRKSRLHDRIVYEQSDNSWDVKRLAP